MLQEILETNPVLGIIDLNTNSQSILTARTGKWAKIVILFLMFSQFHLLEKESLTLSRLLTDV